jgi:hypothetical protein
MFDPDSMRKRFHELGAQHDAILAKSAPLRAKRDQAVALYESVAKPFEAQIREAEAGLYEIDKERAFIARALGGKTGSA